MNRGVLLGGVFDPLHAGHLAYLAVGMEIAAESHEPVLCIVSDAPEKHPPLVPLPDRVAILRSILDTHGKVFHGATMADTIRLCKPRVYVKGREWEGKLPSDQMEACFEVGCQIEYVDTRLRSSSDLLAEHQRAINAEAVAAFEAWVQEQQPAETPWQPVTDYSYEARKAIEGPHADVIADVFAGLSVLDAGCGPGHLVTLLRERGMDARGCDVNPASHVPGLFHADIAVEFWMDTPDSDLVICREVLEHLTVKQVAVAVQNLVKLSSRYVYVTTRFTSKAHLLGFDRSDTLDPTHCTILNKDFLRTLFVLEGCKSRPDLEAKLDHKGYGRVLVFEVGA